MVKKKCVHLQLIENITWAVPTLWIRSNIINLTSIIWGHQSVFFSSYFTINEILNVYIYIQKKKVTEEISFFWYWKSDEILVLDNIFTLFV